MKLTAYVATQADLEYEVDDVIIIIHEGEPNSDGFVERRSWVRGFDDHEWEQAREYAENLAKTLGIEFIGEVAEEYVEEESEE